MTSATSCSTTRAPSPLAHPFGTIDFGFSVKGTHTLWWAAACWDSFAIPNLVPGEPSVLVATTCPACRRPHAWTVTDQAPPEGDQVAHFLVPVTRIWDDVLFTLRQPAVFCDERLPRGWLAREGHARGYATDLATVWRLAKGWYAGRLDEGYRRREPAEAAAYFRSVGCVGRSGGCPPRTRPSSVAAVSRRRAPRAPRPPSRRRCPRRAAP